MSNQETGIYQMKSGFWAYRFSLTIDGEKKLFKSSVDENGNKMTTRKQAIKAKQLATEKARREALQPTKPTKITRRTFGQVFQEYQEKGRSSKAFSTKRKQDCLWEIHLKDKFGSRFVDEISVGEISEIL
ncbi:MAG: hypothetical protein IJ309_06955 [Clostridia bacterium]|nr:hypothetical protein [Clostridia bacterium]